MKNFLKRLRKEEQGNVLYMTIVLMMLLVMFSLVLTNVIYIGVMKVRAQNAADNIALSAATLKARMANTMTNYNGLGFVASNQPLWPIKVAAMVATIGASVFAVQDFIHKVHNLKYIDRIAKNNGIDESNNRYQMFPVHAEHIYTSFLLAYDKYLVFEPNHTWYVQSRVEMKTREHIIGGKMLGFELPDITARARAEILNKNSSGQKNYTHNFRVVLAPPDESVDAYMRRITRSVNSGQDFNRRISESSNNSILPGTSNAITDEESLIDETMNTIPENIQYRIYEQKMREGKITLKEKVRYYDLKRTYGGGLVWWEIMDRQHCQNQLRREEQI